MRMRAGDALGPGDAAVVEHERRAGRAERIHRRLDDRLERLLEVERLRDRLRDPRQRLELAHAPLRLGVELRVLDRLRDLRGDREQQLDLVVAEHARLARAHVQRALERTVARQDRHREDRLVLVLGQVREVLEARIEMRLLGSSITGARAAAAEPVIPSPGRIRGRRVSSSMCVPCVARRTSSSSPLVVEVDEARVRLERVGDVRRDQREHLLEVERRVDGLDRLGQQPQVPVARVHPRRSVRSRP